MKQNTISEILRMLNQQISCEEIQNSLRTLCADPPGGSGDRYHLLVP